jgi:predicted permease
MIRWAQVLLLRVRSLFKRSAIDRDLDKELRYHLEEHAAELVAAGMAPDEARLAAMRAFGSSASISQQCRETRRVNFLENLAQDIRYGARALVKQPMLLVTAASSIALGVGANLAIFGLANSLLLSTPTAADPDRLVHIRTNRGSHTSYGAWRDLEASGVMAGIAGHAIEADMNWRGRDVSIGVTPLVVTANFFDVMGVPIALGRGFTTLDAAAERDPRVVVISHGFWTAKLGADAGVLGSTLALNGHAYTVLGVLPKDIRSLPGYGITPDMVVPISKAIEPGLDAPDGGHLQLIGRLRDGQGAEGARAALNAASTRWVGDDPGKTGFIRTVAPVGGLYQLNEFKEVTLFFGMLLVVTGLVLAIACANVAGLLLARSVARRKEIALRLAIGATRMRIVQQLLTEGFVLAVLGTVAGVAITAALGTLVSRISLPLPIQIAFSVAFDTRFAVLAIALVLASTLLCALAPALQATRVALNPGLKQETRTYGHRRFGPRELMVTGQVAVAVLLLVTTVLFLRNLGMANRLEPGFDAGRAIVAQITFVEGRQGQPGSEAILELADRLRALPGVEAASFAEGMPLTMRYGGNTGTMMRIDGRDQPVRVAYDDNRVGPDYFRVMGIDLLRGREFTASDRGPGVAVIVNEEFVRRYFEGLEPIGRTIYLDGDPDVIPAAVVGVVANSKYGSIGEDRNAALYTPYLRSRPPGRFVHAIVRSAGPPEVILQSVSDAIIQADPAAAVSAVPVSTAIRFAFLPSRVGAGLVGTLGLLGALLAMIGLYGVVSYAVTRRTSEIGIRMALGSSRGAIAMLVFTDGARLVGAGMVIGLIVAFVLTRPLAAFLVAQLPTTDPISFAGPIILLALTSLVAGWNPTRRALRIQPAETLRSE